MSQGIYVSAPKITESTLLGNTAEGFNVVTTAIIAGVVLYFINKSFLNNYPPYVAIILGFLIALYLANVYPLSLIGFALIADGIYKLIKEYVTISS